MKCKNKRCKTCPAVIAEEHVVNLKLEKPICKTTGVIYMLICGCCNIKYIGQTSTPLNLRINNHRSMCNRNKTSNNDIQNKYEFEHFKLHSFNQVKISILNVTNDTNYRLELENLYIIRYKTAYPYGLNDRVNNVSVTSIKDSTCIYKEIFSDVMFNNNLVRNRRRSNNKRNIYIDFIEFVEDLNEAITSKSNIIGYIKGKILGLKRSKAYVLIDYVKDFEFQYYLIKDLVYDLLKFKLDNVNWINQNNSNTVNTYLVIDFEHKYIDTLNIPQLIHNQELISCFPIKETYPKISFKYSQTLGSMVFNYAKFSKELRIEDVEQYDCECENSVFKDDFHNHVVTGDINVLGDNDLINIFKFGSKFRLIPRLNIRNILNDINNRIDTYIHRLSFKFNINIGHFNEWKIKLLNSIRYKIINTPNTFPCTTNIQVFRNKIKEIQNKFIVMPVDKANNNFGFICKKYYAQILIDEINSSNTFEVNHTDLKSISELFISFLKPYNLIPSSFKIPFIYSIPKFHKNPTKFRFITSSFNCINKDCNVILNLALNILNEKVKEDCDSSWIIINNKKVLDAISECNSNPGIPGNYMLATFDFSTLYTALPHEDLIRCIVALYNKYINSEIEVLYRNKKVIISKVQFVKLLKLCVKNNYITFDNRIYKQIIGIPMGSNFSPNMANLYLHFYEQQFLSRNTPDGRNRYKNTYRFIDDLLSMNNRDILFDIRSIYPRFLEIKNTNSDPYRTSSFLDIDIKVVNNNFHTTIYDKRRDFDFEILGLPAYFSNIPYNMTYGIICSQFIRFSNICMIQQDFMYNCQLVINKIHANGFPIWLLKKYINKFTYNKRRSIVKFNLDRNMINYIDFGM